MWACVRRMWRIASDLRCAYASSACTPSPGSMSTASFVFSQPTTKPFCMKGPAVSTWTIMVDQSAVAVGVRLQSASATAVCDCSRIYDHSRSRRSHVHVEDQDDGGPARRGGDV